MHSTNRELPELTTIMGLKPITGQDEFEEYFSHFSRIIIILHALSVKIYIIKKNFFSFNHLLFSQIRNSVFVLLQRCHHLCNVKRDAMPTKELVSKFGQNIGILSL